MGKIKGYYLMPHPPIIVPEVGKGEEEKIKNTSIACNKISEEIEAIKPDTIILVTPHGPVFSDAIALATESTIAGNLLKFGAPEVEIKLDINLSLTEKIAEYAERDNILTANIDSKLAESYGFSYSLDHGGLIPLYFVNQKYTNYKLVHITYGMLSNIELYRFGMGIKKAVEDTNTKAVFIASGDLSHKLSKDGPYEYSPDGKKFDQKLISLLKEGNILDIFNLDFDLIENAGECGLRSIYTMLGAMNGCSIKGEILSYEGTFGVGYGVMKFDFQDNNRDTLNELLEERRKRYNIKVENTDPYIRLARDSLNHYLIYGEYLKTPNYILEEMLDKKRGVFVSLKKEGNLRGCIGTIFPVTENIAEEIIRNAVEAGMRDPRFSPVSEKEIEDIDFSVDILTEPEKTTKDDLDPKKYGVIVKSGNKLGLLLPDLEGVNTIEKQLSIALEKGGISPLEEYRIERFLVIRHRSN